MDVENLDRLLPEEKEELQELYRSWFDAKDKKDWIMADRLRHHLSMWDPNIVNDKAPTWHPHFEQNLNRQRRAVKRIKNYGVPVYPWGLDDADLDN